MGRLLAPPGRGSRGGRRLSVSEVLSELVGVAVPKPCSFGKENFAGDPLVRSFCDALVARHELDLKVYVAWACPPDVLVFQSPVGDVIIRSERLDTLLIEYHHLARAHGQLPEEVAARVGSGSLLRWMCEFLIGYREPEIGVYALTMRPEGSSPKGLRSPFRDEMLASVRELERAAIQCFCLAHEVGHLLATPRSEATLETVVDGLPIARHIESSDRESGLSEEKLALAREFWQRELDAASLLAEIDADLFAFGSVVQFLCSALSSPIEDAIRATLRAFEAQLFLYACKGVCRLVAEAASSPMEERDFVERDYLMGVESAVRARAVARRAGIVWTRAEHQSTAPSARDYNAYVQRVDAIIVPGIPFRILMASLVSEHSRKLFGVARTGRKLTGSAWRDGILELVEKDSEVRIDLYYMLIAFGCPGYVDVVSYLESVRAEELADATFESRTQGAVTEVIPVPAASDG